MATSTSSFPAPLADETGRLRARALGRALTGSGSGSSAPESSLDAIAPGEQARVASVVLEADEAAWLAAVGIRVGERLTVLRRAAFGGPMHVRTRAGGEFALARSLARAILVHRDRP